MQGENSILSVFSKKLGKNIEVGAGGAAAVALDYFDTCWNNGSWRENGWSNYGGGGWSNGGWNNGGGCYITTAVMESRGGADDCKELTEMRALRDAMVDKSPENRQIVLEYYEKAPEIVRAIDASPEHKATYDEIYNDMVTKCVDLYERGDLENAFVVYSDYFRKLEAQYLG